MSAASILAHKSAKAFYEAEKDNPDFNFYNEGEQREEALKAIYAEAAKMQAAYDKAVAAQTAKESDKPDAGKGKSADDKK